MVRVLTEGGHVQLPQTTLRHNHKDHDADPLLGYLERVDHVLESSFFNQRPSDEIPTIYQKPELLLYTQFRYGPLQKDRDET